MIQGKKVIVVLPAYNAGKTLERTVAAIPREVVDDIVLVDDASRDETVAVARSLGLGVVVHPRNRGYGANQKTCYRAALERGADIVVMLHPDYQYDPRLITAMAGMVASGVYGVVLGSRILGSGSTGALAGGMPWWKYVANRALTAFQNLLTGAKLSEYHRSAVQIYVNEAGWYRIAQPELVAAGLSSGINPKLLQLYVDGREIPMRVIGEEDRKFDPQDAIEFYGMGLDELSPDKRVYWLVSGWRAGMRIQGVSGQGTPVASSSFLFTEERKERLLYFAALLNGEESNFFGAVVRSSGPTDQLLTLRHLDPSAPGNATLEVTLQGVTTASHRVKVYLNGSEVGEVVFDGQSQGVFSVEVSQSGLQEGDNLVTLMARGGQTDVSLIGSIRLTYWHTYSAFDNTLQFNSTGGNQHTLAGFSNPNIHVMDITDPEAPIERMGAVTPQGLEYSVTLGVSGAGQRALWVFSEEKAKSPVGIAHNQPSTWSRFKPGYDLVIISHGDLLESVKPLEALRKGQRLRVALIDVEDLYDEFNFGVKSPKAIKDFLTFARTKWWKKPRFVLLVGDASFDPRDSLGLGSFDFVPTKLVDTEYLETASDDWFVDFDSDGLPDLAIGRLPVQTIQEAQTVVSKIINYEQATGMNKAYAAQYGVEFKVEPIGDEVVIKVDRDRFQQVMANLLSNAAKFSPPDSAVRIRVARLGDKVQVAVSDQGAFGKPRGGWRLRLYTVIFESDTPAGRLFDELLIVAILVSVAIVLADSVQSLHASYRREFDLLEWAFTILFTVEYAARLSCVDRPLRYATSFFGIVDLLSILPTYLAVFFPEAQAFIDVRILRLLRMFRVLKLTAYVWEYQAMGRALVASRRKILVFLSAVLMIVVVMGVWWQVPQTPVAAFVHDGEE